MEYTIEKLLAEEQWKQLNVIEGKESCKRKIEGIRIIEVPEMARYLTGGELLLTSLYVYRDCSAEEFYQYLIAFEEKHISGILLKEREQISEKEKKIKLLKTYCESKKIPLIEMPKKISFWEMISFVMNRIFTKDVARLRYFKLTQDNFNTLSFGRDITSSKTQDILELLSDMVDNPVTLYYSNLNCYVTSGGDHSRLELREDLEEYIPSVITKISYMRQRKKGTGEIQYVIKISVMEEVEAYLVVTEKNRKLSAMDCMAIENAIITLQYGFVTEFVQNEIEKKYHRDIVHNVLSGMLGKEEMEEAANLLEIHSEEYYRVVTFYTFQKERGDMYTSEQLRETGIIEGEIMTLCPGQHVYRNIDQIVMIQRVDEKQKREVYLNKMEEMCAALQNAIRYRHKTEKIQVGIGKMVKGIYNLKDSYYEAKRAISYRDIAKVISGNENQTVTLYSDLGFFKLLGDIDDLNTLMDYIPESLQRLYSYNKPQRKDLILTLQTYLDNNQSLNKTAQALFIHYKTATYRIDKIGKMTGMDFKNPNEMLNVRIGLILYKMLEKAR